MALLGDSMFGRRLIAALYKNSQNHMPLESAPRLVAPSFAGKSF